MATPITVELGPVRWSPMGMTLGVEMVEVTEDRAVLTMPVAPAFMNALGKLHGGAVGTLIDVACGAAVNFGDGGAAIRRNATVSMSVQYLDSATSGMVTAEATVIRRGRSISVCEAEVRDENGLLLAAALVTYRIDRLER